MAAYKCPIHGMQIAAHFCEHAEAAINARQPMTVYLQKGEWGWTTVCPACVQLPPEERDTDFLVCGECVVDWAQKVGNDYVERCQDPVNESPPGSP